MESAPRWQADIPGKLCQLPRAAELPCPAVAEADPSSRSHPTRISYGKFVKRPFQQIIPVLGPFSVGSERWNTEELRWAVRMG